MPFKSKKQEGKIRKYCEYCGTTFSVYPSQLKRKGRGRFCSQVCSSRGTVEQRKRFKGGETEYRRRALEAYGEACQKCGYDSHSRLLWVHHKNFKPRRVQDDHSLDNLEVLCVRCHMEVHLAIQKS